MTFRSGTFQVWLGTSHEAQEPETLDISRHLLSGSNPVHHEGNPKAKRHEAPTEIVVPTTKSRSGTKSCSNMEDLGRHDQKRIETTRQWPSLNGKRCWSHLKSSKEVFFLLERSDFKTCQASNIMASSSAKIHDASENDREGSAETAMRGPGILQHHCT